MRRFHGSVSVLTTVWIPSPSNMHAPCGALLRRQFGRLWHGSVFHSVGPHLGKNALYMSGIYRLVVGGSTSLVTAQIPCMVQNISSSQRDLLMLSHVLALDWPFSQSPTSRNCSTKYYHQRCTCRLDVLAFGRVVRICGCSAAAWLVSLQGITCCRGTKFTPASGQPTCSLDTSSSSSFVKGKCSPPARGQPTCSLDVLFTRPSHICQARFHTSKWPTHLQLGHAVC